MPTVDALPTASAISPTDRIVVNQTDEDGTVVLRKVEASALSAVSSGTSSDLPTSGGVMTGPIRPTINDNLVGTGTNQSTALLLTAQNNVISTATGAFRLPATSDLNGVIGPVNIRNKDSVNDANLYPPVGGQIDALGANNPIYIASNTQITLLPGTTAGQWWS